MMVPDPARAHPALHADGQAAAGPATCRRSSCPFLVTGFGVFMMRQYVAQAVPDELIEAARVDGCSHAADLLERRAARRCGRPRRCSALLTFMADLERLPLAATSCSTPDNPTVQVSLRHAVERLLHRLRRWSSPAPRSATLPLLLVFVAVRPADHRRHHGRCGQGVTDRTARPTPATRRSGRRWLPGRASSGARRPRRTRSRARPPRTAARRRSGTPSAARPGAVRRRRHRRRRRATTTTATRDDVGLMAELGPRRRTGSRSPGRGCSPTGAGPVNPARARLLRRLVDELLERGHRAVADALPLGPAAGARGRRRLAGPGHRRPVRRLRRRSCTARSATGCAPGPRSTSRGARRSSATAPGVHAPGPAGRRPPPSGRGAPPAARPRPGRRRRCGRPAPDAEVGITLNLYAVAPADRPARPTSTRPGASTGWRNRFFLDPVLRGRVPGRRARRTSRR